MPKNMPTSEAPARSGYDDWISRTSLGRKPKLTDHQKREAIRRRDLDGEPVREIASSYNVSYSTISRLQSAGINLERSSIWIC
jgi:DNA invertase Pin-like site-specific DNA recombinase